MTLLDMPVAVARRTPKRWTKAEFNRAVEDGWLAGKPIYLYRGELIEMAAMGELHRRGVTRITSWAVRTFEPQYVIGCQVPFELPDESMPEPDFSIVTPEQNRRSPHPNAAVLIIEVSDSSVELDREFADDYAAAGVPDYWIDNVRDGEVEVYRDPVPNPASTTRYRYAEHKVYKRGESIAPLARPDAVVTVDYLTTGT